MPTPAAAISIDLLAYLRKLYQLALKEMVSSEDYSGGINGHTEHAVPAYIVATSAVEAFTNEMLLGPIGQSFRSLRSEGFWRALEGASLSDKLLFAPALHFGETFSTGAAPYQDMHLLIRLRNALVHYKMDLETPNPVKDLRQRGIALGYAETPWTKSISTTEGIRWAHTAASETIQGIIGFADQQSHLVLVQYGHLCAPLLRPITDAVAARLVKELLAKNGESCQST